MGPLHERSGEADKSSKAGKGKALQWGRCMNAAESWRLRVSSNQGAEASMGPLHERSGEVQIELGGSGRANQMLQWGRCMNAAERSRARHDVMPAPDRFNGAAA